MAEVTVTYTPSGQGWTSRWSYNPDWMIGINNLFFSWSNGYLYKHDSNTTRNQFYGVNYQSSITTILNQDPTEVKVFKTLELESNAAWNAACTTDLNTGSVSDTWFVEKEDGWFGHIRRTSGDGDHRAISTQGIGEVQSYNAGVLTFGFGIGNSISVGDVLYKVSGNTLVESGTVSAHTYDTITINPIVSAPVGGDIVAYVKNSVAESYGARGAWMEVTLTNNSLSEVEIFEISSSIFKSFP